jgi:hypothetical protein
MVRDPEEQVTRMGVPSEHLNGHAFHTYQVVSADGMYEVFLSCSLKVLSALCKQQHVLLLNPVITAKYGSDKICVWVGATGLCLNFSTMFVEGLFMLKAQWMLFYSLQRR